MKKVLVTGAAGGIGINVIKYLLAEGKYEITALDLRNKDVIKKLKKYKRRINILYGDVNDNVLIDALVKDQDVVIHLASALPPISNKKKGLAEIIDYNGCENIIRAISYYNPKCHLFFASTTRMYKKMDNPSVKSKIVLDEHDYFEKAKYDTEMLIKEKLKRYTIYRIPLVLSNPLKEPFMYHVKKNSVVDYITKEDCAYAFVKGIKYCDELNKKTFNVCESESILYKNLLNKIVLATGLTWKFVLSRIFLDKNYYSPVCSDKDELENVINYRNTTLNEYIRKLKFSTKKRKFSKFLAKVFIKDKS